MRLILLKLSKNVRKYKQRLNHISLNHINLNYINLNHISLIRKLKK